MRFFFVVNQRAEPSAEQTTTLLMAAAVRRGHQVLVSGVSDFTTRDDGGVCVRACPVEAGDPAAVAGALSRGGTASYRLAAQDSCLVRTNPARDQGRRAEHVAALRMLERAAEQGVRVINGPRGLSRALTKLSLLDLPEDLRPRTLVTCDAGAIERFVESEPTKAVIKPLDGTRGLDVFVLDKDGAGANRRQIIEVVLRRGYAMVQEFVPGAERGDVRVMVVNGKVLEVGGRAAAVARVPSAGDFRSNLHAGGRAEPAEITDDMREAISRIAPLLLREGLAHVGVDFVGGRILELNVFSPGGLYPSERLYGKPFSDAVIEALETEP